MKMKKSLLSLFVLQIIIAMCSLHSYALEKPAHEAINVYIAQNAIKNTKTGFSFSLDEYLKERLGFREGVYEIVEQFEDQKINGEHPTIFRWLGYGGKKEDEPFLLRSVRHFHNPIETWYNGGFKGFWFF